MFIGLGHREDVSDEVLGVRFCGTRRPHITQDTRDPLRVLNDGVSDRVWLGRNLDAGSRKTHESHNLPFGVENRSAKALHSLNIFLIIMRHSSRAACGDVRVFFVTCPSLSQHPSTQILNGSVRMKRWSPPEALSDSRTRVVPEAPMRWFPPGGSWEMAIMEAIALPPRYGSETGIGRGFLISQAKKRLRERPRCITIGSGMDTEL